MAQGGVQIQFVAGTIRDEDQERLRRMLFRVTRGKALTHFSLPYDQQGQQRCVYMVVYQDGDTMRDRVQKICDSFMGSRFEISNLGDPLFRELATVRAQIHSDIKLLKTSKMQLQGYLQSINGKCDGKEPSLLEIFHHFVAKEKSIACVINMMSLNSNTYVGFVWCPVALEPDVKRELAEF